MLKDQLESILFLSNKSLKLRKLVKFFKVDKESLKNILEEIKNDFQDKGINLLIVEHENDLDNEYQFITKTENKEIVKKFYNFNTDLELSRIALETLTIIAYRGPISREELEYIRGVNSAQILNQLKAKELIIENENNLYEVSAKFLEILGIKNVKDLENYEQLHALNIILQSNENEENNV